MIGEASFTYTDQDMIATQRAAWTWIARGRNILVVVMTCTLYLTAILSGLNLYYGTRLVATDLIFVLSLSIMLAPIIFGLLLLSARNHGRHVLRNVRLLERSAWAGHGADLLLDEQSWYWDETGLHVRTDKGRSDLSWGSVGGWLDAPDVLLLFPAVRRSFAPKNALSAEWRNAPTMFVLPFGDSVLALPKRALMRGDTDRIIGLLRSAGRPERRRFGMIAAGDHLAWQVVVPSGPPRG